ncbi:hypothetical protein TNCV_2332321 [Trichonephila clavipes]|nr:hypothetical protein TNCV_2332321 [Trichonephila clavipes]
MDDLSPLVVTSQISGQALYLGGAGKAQFVKKRKQLLIYKKDEPVTIKRIQFGGTRLKLRSNFYGSNLTTVKPHDRYEVEKVGQHEGPHLTSTAVGFMKR